MCTVKKSWAQKEALERTVWMPEGCALCEVTSDQRVLDQASHLVKISLNVESELPP